MRAPDIAAAAIVGAVGIAEREIRRAGVPDHAVEDIALDCIEGTWRASLRQGVDALNPRKLRPFMVIIARRMAWNWRHENRHVAGIQAPDVASVDPMPAIVARADLLRVARLLAPGDRRLLVALADGATFGEVALHLRTPVGTIASRARVARPSTTASELRSERFARRFAAAVVLVLSRGASAPHPTAV